MFKKRGVEIFYTLEPIDDFVLNHLGEYDGKKLVSADRADLIAFLQSVSQGERSCKPGTAMPAAVSSSQP